MTDPFDWDASYREYMTSRKFQPAGALETLGVPTDEDARWLIDGLKDHRKWFVARHFYCASAISEIFFQPLMDAGIDEREPSGCKRFVCPCTGAFGLRKVFEYLYRVIETESDERKIGALLCFFWARCPSPRFMWDDTWRHADQESADALYRRGQELVLRTFLNSSNRLVRFAALREVSPRADEYPEHLRSMHTTVIQAAKQTEDQYTRQLIRHMLEPDPREFPDTWPSGVDDLRR